MAVNTKTEDAARHYSAGAKRWLGSSDHVSGKQPKIKRKEKTDNVIC